MIKQSYWGISALIGTLLVAACAEQTSELEFETPVEELMGQGEAMVENLCVDCHAIGADDASAHPAAPPLRDLSKRLTLEDLRAPLLEGIVTGHPDMPEWAFEPHHVDALLYYLEQIQSE
ncbi:MAG: c-type cytochrome [Henriciella sp.]